MLTKMNKKSEGFTIVEVMIVLGIGGLIMLIVLLAVPALNRTRRNNQRRTDVTAILGAIGEYGSNASGALPAQKSDFMSLAKTSLYLDADVDYAVLGAAPAASYVPGTEVNTVYVRNYAKCSSATAATGTGATRRNVIAFFYVETTGTPQAQCQET